MRKLSCKLSALLLCACLGYTAFGKNVDENTAKSIGSKFLMSRDIAGVQSPTDLTKAYTATATVAGKTVVDYYVFNINGQNGFVMVSGDDLIQPILAYSNESSFDINKIGPETKFWIDDYQNQITYVIEHNLPAQEGVAQQWKDIANGASSSIRGARTTAVSPLLTTTWDQYPYYNNLCPGSGSTKAYTGCVATAMAQVMKYWNWPKVGTGYHKYTPMTVPSYGLQTVDFGNTAYDWANMPTALNSFTPAVKDAAVALLMYHAGVATNMDYGYTAAGSGTYVIFDWSPIRNCAEYALPTYFRYKPSLKGLSRDATPSGLPLIPQATWISDIETELNAGRPVIYSGQESSGGGHCWVCDGYDASNNMHFNFGWSGAGNGYYSVNAITPSGVGIGGGTGTFNNTQCIIIGIQPDTTAPATASGNLKMLSHLDLPWDSPLGYDGGFTVTAKVLNGGSSTFKGDFCVQVFDMNNNLNSTVQTISGQTITAGDSTAVLTFGTGGLWQMIPGKYSVMLMYRATGTSAWTAVPNNGSFINYNRVDVENSQSIELYDSLHVGSHTITRHSPMNITTKVANLGSAAFNGTVQAVLINVSTGAAFTVQQYTGQTINPSTYQSYTFTNSSITASPGEYVLAVRHQPGGAGSYVVTGSDLYENPIIFNIVSPVDVSTLTANADKISVYPNPASDVLNVDLNGISVNEIHILDMEGREVMKSTVPTGQQKISIPVANLMSGMYLVQLQSGDELVTRKVVIAK